MIRYVDCYYCDKIIEYLAINGVKPDDRDEFASHLKTLHKAQAKCLELLLSGALDRK
jgi:hypothetical protein